MASRSLNDKAGKQVIEFGLSLSKIINNDREVSKCMKLVYVPNYNVSVAEVLIPGMDLSEHISLVGTEASGTSNMKAAMNGAVIIGTYDGANLEIAQEVKSGKYFLFGMKNQDVAAARTVRLLTRWPPNPTPSTSPRSCGDHGGSEERATGDPKQFDWLNNLLDLPRRPRSHLRRTSRSTSKPNTRSTRPTKTATTGSKSPMYSALGMVRFTSDRTALDYSEHVW